MDLAKHSGFTNNWGDYKSNWMTTNQIKSNEMLVFGERQKPEIPSKEKSSKNRAENQQTQPTEDGIKPVPHWWKASTLTTVPVLF